MKLNKRDFLKAVGAGSAIIAMPSIVRATPFDLKLSHYLPPPHQLTGALARWADDMREQSDGALNIEVFPAGQMGPPPRQYDLARTGVADFSFVFTAFHPGRFPLTDLLSLPFFLVGSDARPRRTADTSWLATNLKSEFASEYVDTEMLFSINLTATGFFMNSVQVRTPEDVNGLRIRPTSSVMAEQLNAMGASPATIPPTEIADSISKGVVDGAIFNFEGGRAFQLQQAVTQVSTLASSSATFSFIANQGMMNNLPEELAALIRNSTGPDAAREIGALYDSSEASGREFMIENGVEVFDLVEEAADPFRAVLEPVFDAQVEATLQSHPTTDAILSRIEQLKAEI